MRQCKIASGCKSPNHPCCAECARRDCDNRCRNSPERCGCWQYFSPPGKASPPSPLRGRSKIDREAVLRLHKRGLLQREIAQRLGCSASTVSTALREMGENRYG